MSAQRGSQPEDVGIPGGPLRRANQLYLEYCPVCGPSVPLTGQVKTHMHIAEHDPEDFGLSPLREGSS